MAKPITIEGLRLTGFRAYLQPQPFSLYRGNMPLSLAVFAPNAKGKSSLVDAFEFYFSTDATLSRLGIRAAERNAGRAALEHVDAQTKGVTPAIEFSFREGADKFGDSRAVTQYGSRLSAAADRVRPHCVVPFIIRGYELRAFVEQQTPEKRYEEIVEWFGLQPLLTIQRNLRVLRRQVKQRAESTTERQERLRDLSRITGNALTEWSEESVCSWLNEQVVAKVDSTLTVGALSAGDTGYQKLKTQKALEDETLGITSLKRVLTKLETLYKRPTNQAENAAGAIVTFENAASTYSAAASREAEERASVSQAAFDSVWTAAKNILEGKSVLLEACPVCDTQFAATPHGSRDAVHLSLTTKLGDLTAYRQAEGARKTAETTIAEAYRVLGENLATLIASLKDTDYYAGKIKSLEIYQQALSTWKTGSDTPPSTAAVTRLDALHTEISAERQRIEEQQGEHTYANALTTVDSLMNVKDDLLRVDRTNAELLTLNARLNQQSLIINKAIVEHTQSLVGELKDNVNSLYKDIQGDGTEAPPIHFELPDDEDTNQQRIQLLINFADNRKGVVPSGYLSDSQIHTLALSLRLAAIRLFNTRFPVIVLDDIVSSYDAEHRKNIAAMLAKHLGHYQIVLVTLDERFFMLLQDHLPQSAWTFRRITELKRDLGPIFHDHQTPDEVIQLKLDSGQSAANEIRQAEEEWLLDICRGFRAKTIIRPVDNPYKYERSELAAALASFLKSASIVPPQVSGMANPFLVSLQKGSVENFGSHFSDNPNESASSGDEKARWKEFTYFRDKFACPKCGSRRYVRPEPLTLPVCKKCQTPFSFKDA